MQILKKKRLIYVKKRKNQMNSYTCLKNKMKKKKRVNMITKKLSKINKLILKSLIEK